VEEPVWLAFSNEPPTARLTAANRRQRAL